MVHRSSSLAPWAALPLLLPALSCADEQGLEIRDVDFDGSRVLTLRFAEPLGEIGEVDPADFRISWARSRRLVDEGEVISEFTFYEDLSSIVDGYTGYGDYAPFFQFSSAELGASPRELILRANTPAPDGLCQRLEDIQNLDAELEADYPGSAAESTLFLHYAAGDIPIASESGSVLADIGPDWVRENEFYLVRERFGFTLRPRLHVPCPLP